MSTKIQLKIILFLTDEAQGSVEVFHMPVALFRITLSSYLQSLGESLSRPIHNTCEVLSHSHGRYHETMMKFFELK